MQIRRVFVMDDHFVRESVYAVESMQKKTALTRLNEFRPILPYKLRLLN